MPKIFQICGDFPNEHSTIFAITHQLETIECRSNPQSSYYSLECIKISRGFAPVIRLHFRTPRDVDVMECFEKPVKTTCGFVNIARKVEIAR